jgi:metal-responsive CopG/Arc/MetJ family transcriptional regulator
MNTDRPPWARPAEVRFAVPVDDRLRLLLDAVADLARVSRAEIVRRAVREWLTVGEVGHTVSGAKSGKLRVRLTQAQADRVDGVRWNHDLDRCEVVRRAVASYCRLGG